MMMNAMPLTRLINEIYMYTFERERERRIKERKSFLSFFLQRTLM